MCLYLSWVWRKGYTIKNTEYEIVNLKKKPVWYNSIFINRCEFIIMENLIENLKIITYALYSYFIFRIRKLHQIHCWKIKKEYKIILYETFVALSCNTTLKLYGLQFKTNSTQFHFFKNYRNTCISFQIMIKHYLRKILIFFLAMLN